ncbi:hypothetical protein QUB63_26420 [Microcoleus sp. ARI1-B5]|uniref:hypothetical protein n=1 Tax=unclassified Microcoleus TaxID=2642155 RepID=UPI002FD01EA1
MSVRGTVPVFGRVIAKSQISNGMTFARHTTNPVARYLLSPPGFWLFRFFWSIVINTLKFLC